MPVAIGVQHATLNWEDPSCHCGPARHTEHRGSQLIEENDEGEEGEEEEEGGEETDIKSNNPHLTGGEKEKWEKQSCVEPNMTKKPHMQMTHADPSLPTQCMNKEWSLRGE